MTLFKERDKITSFTILVPVIFMSQLTQTASWKLELYSVIRGCPLIKTCPSMRPSIEVKTTLLLHSRVSFFFPFKKTNRVNGHARFYIDKEAHNAARIILFY